MRCRAVITFALGLVATASGHDVARATLPPDDLGDTDFVRGQAEREVTAFFAESDAAVADVACTPPPQDSSGAQMLCYGTDSTGSVVTAVATINDDGGIEVAPAAVAGPALTTVPPGVPEAVFAAYNGSGSAVRPVDPITAPTIVRVTHDGAAAFSVQPQHGGVAAGAPLLQGTGPSEGRYLVGLGGTISGFAITADGNWTLELHDVATALALAPGSPVTGESPDVLSYSAGEINPVSIEYTGAGPVVVRTVTGAGTTVVLDEAGAFSGELELPPGPGNVLVDANGPWQLSSGAPSPTTTAAPVPSGAPTTATVAPTTTTSTTVAAAPTSAPFPTDAATSTETSAP